MPQETVLQPTTGDDASHKRYDHAHPPVKNANLIHRERLTIGGRLADGFAKVMGSWTFISLQSVVLLIWLTLNVVGWFRRWDPYPFILLNLILSFQAAYAAPIIMMSQNRQDQKDRIAAHLDYETNLRTEQETRLIIEYLERQAQTIAEMRAEIESLRVALEPR